MKAEIKAGYKQTDIGVIPEDWDVKPLENIGRFSKGLGILKDESQSGSIPCVRYGELYTKHNDIIQRFYSFISKEVARGSRKIKCGDILFACSGETKEEIGKCATFMDNILAYAGGDIIILSPHSDNSEFLGYLLNSDKIARKKASIGQGDAVVHINSRLLYSILIPLPKLEEQKAIAAVLSDVDGLIESIEQLITKKRDMKTAAMQQLLTGKKRLPGFENKSGYKKTEIGIIPEDWDIVRLNSISNIKTGSKNNQDKLKEGKYPFFVRSSCVERINSYSHDCEAILIPGEGNIGSIFHYINGRFNAHQRVYVITKFNNFVFGRYIFYYLSQYFGKHALQNTVKATVDSLRLPTFKSFQLGIPHCKEEQTAIAAILSDMDAEIESLVQRLKKAKALKTSMMQELLTGKTRLIQPKQGRA